jgi:hypothetical protein
VTRKVVGVFVRFRALQLDYVPENKIQSKNELDA